MYNLDKQVCLAFCQGAINRQRPHNNCHHCSCRKIKHPQLKDKPVIAITLGAGSTAASKRVLETIIHKKDALLSDSRSFWLMRPNNDSRIKEKYSSSVINGTFAGCRNGKKNRTMVIAPA